MSYTVNYSDGIGIPTADELEEEFVNISPFVLDKMSELPESAYIFLCMGYELALLRFHIKEIRKQMRVDTATWGLVFFEEEWGVKIDLNDTLENRRAQVKAKMKGQKTSTVKQLEYIASAFGEKANIIEDNLHYSFSLKLLSENGFSAKLDSLYKSIDEVKPAHLNIDYSIRAQIKNNIYVGASSFFSEKITIYPWHPRTVRAKNVTYNAMSNYLVSEKIKIYPKEV